MSSPCAIKVNAEHPEVTPQQAEDILLRTKNLATEQAKLNGGNMHQALEETKVQLTQRDKLLAAVAKRNTYLNAQAEERGLEYIQRFPTLGEGILALEQGSGYKIPGARDSIDAQFRNIDHTAFGEVAAELEKEGVFRQFRRNELAKEVYIESANLAKGSKPGSSGSKDAMTIARIIDAKTKELTARINRAGGFIADMPGYLARQTHDMMKIRAAGDTKEEAFHNWKDFITPKLDVIKTFAGADQNKMLRNMFNNLYSGVHGVMGEEGEGIGNRSLANKLSQERIIHFKSPEDAWDYNSRFGSKDLKEQVMTDVSTKARAIALMENLGPSPEATLLNITRRAKEMGRDRDDAAKQVDSIRDDKIMATYRQLTGVNDIPANPNLARFSSNVRVVTQMIDMGRILLTNLFSDRAFMQTELAYQGIGHMTILAKQLTGLAKRSPEQIRTLRLMGVGLDSIIGNALSRYSAQGTASKMLDKAQKLFFDINMHNYWSDVTKASTAEVMAAHAGQHAEMTHEQLPQEYKDLLSLYNIGPHDWDAIRSTAYEHPSNWGKLITPDQVKTMPDEAIAKMLQAKGESVNAKSILRARDALQTKFGTMISDRTEYSVPIGGAQVRRILTADTKAGTGIGEVVRMMGLFKSFPMAVATKVIQREIYGRGNLTAKQWLLNDHAGKFHLAQLAAITTVAGYLGMAIRDALDGKNPKPLIDENGAVNMHTLNESAIRGGGLGIMGEMLMNDYDSSYRNILKTAAGPIVSKLDTIAEMKSKAIAGEPVAHEAGKFSLDNTPLINLFYIRPILNYYVLWNLQEMMNPGSLKRTEQFNENKNNQTYYYKHSDHLK